MATPKRAGRRANREGSIFQRKDGRWAADVSLPGGKRKTVYGKTRAEALQKLKAIQRSVDDGLPVSNERLTVAEWLETWLQDHVPNKARPRTLHRYREIVHYHLAPRLGRIRLGRLTPADVERAMNEAREAGQSPQSVAHHRAVLRTALNVAVRHGLTSRNSATLAYTPHVPERDQQAITPERAKAVLEAVRGDRLEALYLLMLATGLRLGEALALRWGAVDLDGGTVSVRYTLQRIEGVWRFLEPKTKRSRRTVPVPAPVVQALRQHWTRQAEERLQLGVIWEGDQWGDLVFTNERGGPLTEGYALHHFQKLLELAGLPRMRLHDLRHAAASLFAALGVPPRVAMELLGHSQIATTMNVYTHVTPEYQREAMEQVSRGLWAEGH